MADTKDTPVMTDKGKLVQNFLMADLVRLGLGVEQNDKCSICKTMRGTLLQVYK